MVRANVDHDSRKSHLDEFSSAWELNNILLTVQREVKSTRLAFCINIVTHFVVFYELKENGRRI